MAMERAFTRQRSFNLFCNSLPAEFRRFEAHIKQTYQGVVFDLMVRHNPLVRKVIELTWIIVNDRKRGRRHGHHARALRIRGSQ
jgi:hypothetical protein